MNQQTNSDLVSGEIKDKRERFQQWAHQFSIHGQQPDAWEAWQAALSAVNSDLVKALQEANFRLQAMQVDYTGTAAQSIYVLRERIGAALRKAGVK